MHIYPKLHKTNALYISNMLGDDTHTAATLTLNKTKLAMSYCDVVKCPVF